GSRSMAAKQLSRPRATWRTLFNRTIDRLLRLRDLFLNTSFSRAPANRWSKRRLRFQPLEERHLLAAYPVLQSLNGTNPVSLSTNQNNVSYTATFSSPVTGVDASDFSVVKTGSVATTSLQVTRVSTQVYTVTIGGISGTGSVGLNLVDNGSIRDAANNGL